MASRVAIFVADGTEPIEAIGPTDILRRGGVDVQLVSTTDEREITFEHNVTAVTDATIGFVDIDGFDMLVIPGGSLGVENLGNCTPLNEALTRFMKAGRKVSSICAGPTILAELGLLDGRKATCYPGCEGGFPAGVYQKGPGVVVDGNLITASGPGKALAFGFAMLESLEGSEVATAVKTGMLAQ